MVRREWRHDPPERADLPRQDAGPDLYRRSDGDLSRLPRPRSECGSDQARARPGITSRLQQRERGAFELPVFYGAAGICHYFLCADRNSAYPLLRIISRTSPASGCVISSETFSTLGRVSWDFQSTIEGGLLPLSSRVFGVSAFSRPRPPRARPRRSWMVAHARQTAG